MSNTLAGKLHFRPGGLEDITAVQQICADVWNGQDYVPQAWPRFVQESQTQAYILELDGEQAGLYCLRTGLAGPGTAWIQSVRVASRFKKRGLAAAIIQHSITTSSLQNLKVLRFVTAGDNAAMHRLAEQFGFRFIVNFLDYRFEPANIASIAAQSWRFVTTSEFDEAFNLVINSVEYRLSEGFYANQWWWKPLNIDRLRQHLEKKEVYSLNGTLRTMAIMSQDEEGGSWLSLLTGKMVDQQNLLVALTRMVAATATANQDVKLSGLFIQAEHTESIIKAVGFVPDANEPLMSLYELPLK